VLLQNGDLIQINDVKDIRSDVKKIIDLGEILIPFGEFIENNALLPDASYVYEWWVQELQQVVACIPTSYNTGDVGEADYRLQQKIDEDFGRHVDVHHPLPQEAFALAERYHVPLHPDYNLFWHDLPIDDVVKLTTYVKEHGKLLVENEEQLLLPNNPNIKNILIELGALHKVREGSFLIDHYTYPLIRCCGLDIKQRQLAPTDRWTLPTTAETTLSYVSKLAGVQIRARGPFRIGTRMGRPEKASPRKMRPPPHVLFPLGDYGGNQRLVKTAAENVTIEVEVGKRRCPTCNAITFHLICACGTHTEVIEGKLEKQMINLSEELQRAQKNLKEHTLPETIKGVMGTISKHKTPEPLEKGILRAKHNVYVFKDGTIRFDMTDAPLTHFKPKEIGVPLKRIRELGYTKDYLGKELENEDQICELKVQDVVVSTACADYFVLVSKFIDDLLTKFYGIDRFYKVKKNQDLVGHLVVGLAPHTSAGALGRIIGFTTAQVCFAHPFYHATKRRNADGDEDGLMLLMDALLNFSHAYIPDKRGGRMDLPLILTTRLDPSEVDKEAHNLDTLGRYPLEFYEATLRHEHSKNMEAKMGLVAARLGTELQYEQFCFTHDTNNISEGPRESLYKTLKTMMEKMNAQLSLAARIRAVDEADVAYKVIERHFLPDILGNLRAFSKQSVRCPLCNTTYRRIPLQGICTKCNGKLTLTVHQMSVKKYLNISKEIAEKYNLPVYARQRIALVEKSIDSTFMSDKVKNTKLSDFF
jgi:DNA polymerase II large subunit